MARKVPRSEWVKDKCRKALDKEWNRLRDMPWPDGKGKGTWNENKVVEAAEVRKRANKPGAKPVHFSRICELLYEKNAELEEDDELRKMKGRAVLLGNQIFDQGFDWAEFQELSSSPPSMEAARAADALGLFPGYIQTQSDAISAYTQAFLKGPETYVSLPKNRWPKHWENKYKNPVVPLVLALYGHPDAGGFWEEQCDAAVKSCGFQDFKDSVWRSTYWYPKEKHCL